MTPRLRRLRGQNLRVRSRPLRDDVCPHLGRPNAVTKDMEKFFMLSGASQMPLACRVPLASREVQIQLMGWYSVAYPDLVFREDVSVFRELGR